MGWTWAFRSATVYRSGELDESHFVGQAVPVPLGGFKPVALLAAQGRLEQKNNMDAKIQMALSHPRRTEIFGRLTQQKDGTSEDELAAEFGMSVPLVMYHLTVLQSAELVTQIEDSEQSAYVAAGAGR